MAGVIENLVSSLAGQYASFNSSLSPGLSVGLNVFFVSIILAVAAIFIYKLYSSLSEKNIIDLNLKQHNTSSHPAFSKLGAIFLFFVEYLVIMPLLIFLWFAGLSVLLLLIIPDRTAGQILLISGALVGAIRILAYHKKEVAVELAKLFPFVAISVFLMTPGIFDLQGILLRVNGVFASLGSIFYFLFVIFAIEFVLRIFYTIMEIWQSEEE